MYHGACEHEAACEHTYYVCVVVCALLTSTSLDCEVHLKAIWDWGIQSMVNRKVIVNKGGRKRGCMSESESMRSSPGVSLLLYHIIVGHSRTSECQIYLAAKALSELIMSNGDCKTGSGQVGIKRTSALRKQG